MNKCQQLSDLSDISITFLLHSQFFFNCSFFFSSMLQINYFCLRHLFFFSPVTQLRNVLLTLSIVSKMFAAAPRPVAKASRQGDA